MKRLMMFLCAAALMFAPHAAFAQAPAPVCTDADKRKIQVELDGIEALRKHGIAGVSLNALRGVCTAVRSVEGSMSWITEPVIKKALELLKSQGYDFGDDTHIIASLCANIHHYTDEFTVGYRDRELKEKLELCNRPCP